MKDPRELTDEDVVVVCNTTDMPHVADVEIRRCDFCDAEVWFAKTTVARLEQAGVSEYYLMCQKCAAVHAQDEKWMMPSDEQLLEAAKAAGVPFDQVKERITSIIASHNMEVDTWPKED